MRLEQTGFNVLTHRPVPSNDGGIALGPVPIAAARAIKSQGNFQEGEQQDVFGNSGPNRGA